MQTSDSMNGNLRVSSKKTKKKLYCRMETVKLRTSSGMAKIAGVLICIAGAATIAFYKGPHLQLMLHHHLFGHHTSHEHQSHVSSGATWVKGCLLMLMSNTFWGLWLVLQVVLFYCTCIYIVLVAEKMWKKKLIVNLESCILSMFGLRSQKLVRFLFSCFQYILLISIRSGT